VVLSMPVGGLKTATTIWDPPGGTVKEDGKRVTAAAEEESGTGPSAEKMVPWQ
jgi:hypothetical protein